MKTIIRYDIDELNNMFSEDIQEVMKDVKKYLHQLEVFNEVAKICEEE